mmetsp:Transcript_22813/g.28254  ORF Transcript_22813/g.28254 Transcript_22813/m.28254 type:complete len:118 (+) Transcript_22813:2115-2468(+)
MFVNKRRGHVYKSPTGTLGMTTAETNKIVPPKLNLNEIVTAPFLHSSQQRTTQDSHRKKSPREFELLKVNTFELPFDLDEKSLESARCGPRKIIHVNKRPSRDPFYCEPNKETYSKN